MRCAGDARVGVAKESPNLRTRKGSAGLGAEFLLKRVCVRMNYLPEELFANPVWHALHSKHRKFAKYAGDACRYPADVVPFAAIKAPQPDAMRQAAIVIRDR
jgi:hypothetical protein